MCYADASGGLRENKKAICPGTQTYEDVKSQACRSADIPTDPKQDGKDQSCDALSLGLRFNAQPAKLGPITKDNGSPAVCVDAGPDDCQ